MDTENRKRKPLKYTMPGKYGFRILFMLVRWEQDGQEYEEYLDIEHWIRILIMQDEEKVKVLFPIYKKE